MGNLINLMRYKTWDIIPQVDPEFMAPIFGSCLAKTGFYSEDDHQALWKISADEMVFQYGSRNKEPVFFNGSVYAQKPRKNFQDTDLVSYMKIDMIYPDESEEMFQAIEDIAQQAGIERVLAHASIGVTPEYAERINRMKGGRRDLRYGLGIFCRNI